MQMRGLKSLITAGLVGGAGIAGYTFVIRPWHQRWGATRAEAEGRLPGDELITDPRYRTTRAVSIRASAGDVWPWLLQMGQSRAGFYSYDWLENLFGLNVHSSDQVVAELQDLKVGDIIPMAGGSFGPRVVELEPRRSLVVFGVVDTRLGRSIGPDDRIPAEFFVSSWAFVLRQLDSNSTRLIVRFSLDWDRGLINEVSYRALFEPIHFVMERKMLLGIRRRAENSSLSRQDRKLASAARVTSQVGQQAPFITPQ
jgi:hypothetical protein